MEESRQKIILRPNKINKFVLNKLTVEGGSLKADFILGQEITEILSDGSEVSSFIPWGYTDISTVYGYIPSEEVEKALKHLVEALTNECEKLFFEEA